MSAFAAAFFFAADDFVTDRGFSAFFGFGAAVPAPAPPPPPWRRRQFDLAERRLELDTAALVAASDAAFLAAAAAFVSAAAFAAAACASAAACPPTP